MSDAVSRPPAIVHVPDRRIVLTSYPPQYPCGAPDGTRNPCYSHPCDWEGWSDYEEIQDGKPLSRAELRAALAEIFPQHTTAINHALRVKKGTSA